MSSSTLAQLSDTYKRVIEATLKRVRETGILRDSGREVLDELECRWRAATNRELASMEARRTAVKAEMLPVGRHGLDAPSLVPAESLVAPTSMGAALRVKAEPFRPMDGVDFADGFQLPAPVKKEALPAPLKCSQGFKASHVEAPESRGAPGQLAAGELPSRREAGAVAAASPQKKARTKAPKQEPKQEPAPLQRPPPSGGTAAAPAPLTTPAPPPLAPSKEAAALPSADASDDEYDGCFDGAEVIDSDQAKKQQEDAEPAQEQAVVPAHVGAGAPEAGDASSAGSELGSDLDDSEFEEPQTDNVLYAELTSVLRSKKCWKVQMRHGIMHVDGVECLFSSGQGVFEVAEMAEGVEPALEDEADGGASAGFDLAALGEGSFGQRKVPGAGRKRRPPRL